MKKLLFFVFFATVVALFVMGSSVGATGVNTEKMTPTEAPNIFYDEEYGGYYDVNSGGYIEVLKVEEGKVVGEVDMKEYIKRQASEPNLKKEKDEKEKDLTTDTKAENDEISMMAPTVWYRYTESSNYGTILYGSRASIIQKNYGPGDDRMTIGYSATKSHSFATTLNSGEQQAVKAGVGYTFVSSESVSGSHMMTIPAGYQGYWRFDPRVRVSSGTVRQYTHGYVTDSKSAKIYYPVRIGSVLDGELVSVKTPL